MTGATVVGSGLVWSRSVMFLWLLRDAMLIIMGSMMRWWVVHPLIYIGMQLRDGRRRRLRFNILRGWNANFGGAIWTRN